MTKSLNDIKDESREQALKAAAGLPNARGKPLIANAEFSARIKMLTPAHPLSEDVQTDAQVRTVRIGLTRMIEMAWERVSVAEEKE